VLRRAVLRHAVHAQGIEYLCKRIGVKNSQMDLEGHRILAAAACSLVSEAALKCHNVVLGCLGAWGAASDCRPI
jgi:hypothetical protein